jgi:putative hydrolase of the HAD superfamily
MSFTTLYFDLDDTLYPNENGLWAAIRHRMGQFMSERLGLPPEQVPELRRYYFQTYGTTLRGLQKHYQVDADEYLAYVHDLPLEKYILPDPGLKMMLEGLPQRRYIFTNADADHAQRVLNILEVGECFDGIIDVRAIGFACKPEQEAYLRALALSGNPDPHECVMLDDSAVNLEPARDLGFTTVRVSLDGADCSSAMYVIPSLHQLHSVLPELWLQDPLDLFSGEAH